MSDMEKIVKCFEFCRVEDKCSTDCPYWDNSASVRECTIKLAKDVLTLLKEQEPKTPIHIHKEYLEHDWKRDEDGEIDEFAMEYGFHNGPMCKRCGYSFCEHCKPDGWNEKPCVIDYYQCPKCRKYIFKNSKNIEYCVDCGQAVKWE